MRQIMRSSLDYVGFAQLCGRSLIMHKIMHVHNRIIPRSLHYITLSSKTILKSIQQSIPSNNASATNTLGRHAFHHQPPATLNNIRLLILRYDGHNMTASLAHHTSSASSLTLCLSRQLTLCCSNPPKAHLQELI